MSHIIYGSAAGRLGENPFQLTAKFEGLFCPLVSSHPLPAHRDTGGEGGEVIWSDGGFSVSSCFGLLQLPSPRISFVAFGPKVA